MKRWAAWFGSWALLLGACAAAEPEPWSNEEWGLIQSLSLPRAWAEVGSELSPDDAAFALGRDLFFDVRLSRSGSVSCASCHRPERFFTDGRPRARGEAELARNTPTLLGAGQLPFLGWDGSKDSLWARALAPLEAPSEHGLARVEVAQRVLEHYGARLARIRAVRLPDLRDARRFPPGAGPAVDSPEHPSDVAWSGMSQSDRHEVNRVFTAIGKLLAAYVQRLLPRPAPFDEYVAAVRAGDPRGGERLSPRALRGLRAFIGAGRCVACHHGPLLSDHEFHNLGLPAVIGVPDAELGRSEGARRVKQDEFRCGTAFADPGPCPSLRFLDPTFPEFSGAFKTPTLRNVAETGPYMHDGQFSRLEEVIEFYRTLPGRARRGARDPMLRRLERGVRTDALVEFLRSLSGPPPDP